MTINFTQFHFNTEHCGNHTLVGGVDYTQFYFVISRNAHILCGHLYALLEKILNNLKQAQNNDSYT